MAREKFSTLTEQMFYILLCLREECCGMDVMARVNELTGGRVAVGPGTLYNLLEQFLAAGYIVETRAEGRRRSYQLTAEGKTLLQNEVERLQAQVRDYEKLLRDNAPCGRREMRESEVFLMRNTKRELNPYSFYDTEGLARHFERMAAEGWAPDRVGLFIRYRRIKPQKLRFANTYYPDDGDADGEDVFLEYCAQAGWQQSAGVGDLTFWGDGAEGEGGGLGGRTRHVLCTADENAVDVETDPVLQVDAMHRALKYYHSMMIFWFGYMLLRIWDILTGLKTDPLNTLIYGMGDFLSCISPVVTLICGTDLICYNSWYRKAARTAREEHRFLPAKSRLWLQILERAALLLTLFGILVRALLGTGGSSMGRLYLAAILCGITPFAAMFLTYSAVKTGAGRAKRCIVTACVTAAVALASVGVLLTMEQNGLFDSDEVPPELYDEEFRATVYHDALPLYLSDLGVADENARWSCLSWEMSSPFASQRGGVQEDALGYPDPNDPNQYCGTKTRIYYTVSDVYLSALFDRCLSTELDYQERHPESPYVYNEVDAAPWDAEQAWRLYNTDTGEWCDYWLLMRGTRIVKLVTTDLKMTDARMAVVGEKLLNADIK